MILLTTFVLAYLIGSIPFGLLLTRLAGTGDLRQIGSGNIGATNVMRTGRKGLAAATLILDMGKGAAVIWYAGYQLHPYDFMAFAGLLAILGHVFPVWLRFKGGKGVATTFGVLIALNWMLGSATCAMWLGVFYFTRMSSLASLVAIGWSAVIAYVLYDMPAALLCLSAAAIITVTHHDNIKRILQGTELAFKDRRL